VSSQFEQTGSEVICEGKFIALERRTFRHEDGEEVDREIVTHPGAVGIVVLDGDDLWLVRQPRELVGSSDMLELPAGKLDEEGEDIRATAERELAEEIGKGARTWEKLTSFYTTPGFADEEMHLYLATDLYDREAETEENERIEVVEVPLERLDETIEECEDAKSLVGLLWFRAYHR